MRVIVPALAFILLASIALAGPNAGGVLVLHATTLEYTTDVATYEWLSGVACGQDGPRPPGVQQCPPYDPWEGADPCDPSAANPTSTMPSEVPHIWYVMAAFPPESCPRLKTLGFRIRYNPTKVAVVANGVADSQVSVELPIPSDSDHSAFPSNRSGMALAFLEARTSLLQEIWWFAGYSYSGATEATFAVEVLEGEGNGSFGDDSFPAQEDLIAGFGILGLGGATGFNPTWVAIGACCTPAGTCTVVTEAACAIPNTWRGAGTNCLPNPCPQPAGACCLPAAICTVATEAACAIPSAWQGAGTTCIPNPCPAAPGLGSIVAWGWNASGQCDVPAPNAGFVAVTAGESHSLGLKSDGTVVAWGLNDWGQCNIPAPNAEFTAVAAGAYHSLGVKSDGTIVAWGWNDFGQCNVPEPNGGFVAAAAGYEHSLGLKSDGSIVAWGGNASGQCDVPSPNAGFTAVAAGLHYSLGIRSGGTIVAWGSHDFGECNIPSPNAGFAAAAGGALHGLGLKSDGAIVAWGYNDQGQCNVPSPNSEFVAVAAGPYHGLGLKSDGTIRAWGANWFGQCNVPAPNVGFVAVAGGWGHSLGLQSGGTISGACCHQDDTCTLSLDVACAAGSIWQGAGTSCTPNPCSATPVLLESWAASSLAEGLQIRWEVPLGTTGALYRAWRDPTAGPHDVAPTPEAVLVSSAWISASAEGIIETLDREVPRGTAVRYFLETSSNGRGFIGPVEARWDPPALAWSAGPTPFRGAVRLTPPGTGPARAEIFDLAGRLIRTLLRADGNVPMEWDGRDGGGHDAPAGIYMVRVGSTAGTPVARLVKLR